eukprot:TRINITY_DN1020_c0_g1_i1.p1 TRINITY_DN1020_c0_g1~~TRINITY_DN1020_c0_g1_i1.p1  ORF type:complete len:477 (+),score=55.61 TRINITY_DN1020_c0_g1_i1:69-1433(+)
MVSEKCELAKGSISNIILYFKNVKRSGELFYKIYSDHSMLLPSLASVHLLFRSYIERNEITAIAETIKKKFNPTETQEKGCINSVTGPINSQSNKLKRFATTWVILSIISIIFNTINALSALAVFNRKPGKVSLTDKLDQSLPFLPIFIVDLISLIIIFFVHDKPRMRPEYQLNEQEPSEIRKKILTAFQVIQGILIIILVLCVLVLLGLVGTNYQYCNSNICSCMTTGSSSSTTGSSTPFPPPSTIPPDSSTSFPPPSTIPPDFPSTVKRATEQAACSEFQPCGTSDIFDTSSFFDETQTFTSFFPTTECVYKNGIGTCASFKVGACKLQQSTISFKDDLSVTHSKSRCSVTEIEDCLSFGPGISDALVLSTVTVSYILRFITTWLSAETVTILIPIEVFFYTLWKRSQNKVEITNTLAKLTAKVERLPPIDFKAEAGDDKVTGDDYQKVDTT